MAVIPFAELPDSARVWIFAASDSLAAPRAEPLLHAVDEYLEQWKGHGLPLTCARDWRDDRFLAIGVDQRDAHASGCSIDGLFRTLQRLEPALGTSLVGAGRVFYRDADGKIVCVSRGNFAALAAARGIADDTPVFDTAIVNAATYRERFEQPASASWHGALLPK
ncbi:MAG: hypothetical protein ACT4P6_05135 [Gemmatimonadaceae bacterium]